jgi:chromosome segregation ATPase
MPIQVVTKSPNFGVGSDEKAWVPSLDDLNKKADVSWVEAKADASWVANHQREIEELWRKGGEIQQRLKEKVDKTHVEEAFENLTAELKNGKWNEPFKGFVESQTHNFLRALEAEHRRFDAQLEALQKEVKAGQELPERLQRVAVAHKEEVATLLQSFTESLTQKASEIGRMHKDCLSTRDDIQRELQVIHSLLREAKQFRDEAAASSAKIYEQLKALEGIKEKAKEELAVMLGGATESLTQKASEVGRVHNDCIAASDDIQRSSQAVQSLLGESKRCRDEARDYCAKTSAQLKSLEGISGTFWKRLQWLFVGTKPPQL